MTLSFSIRVFACLVLSSVFLSCVGPAQNVAVYDSHDPAAMLSYRAFSGKILLPDGKTPLADAKLELRDMAEFDSLILIPDSAPLFHPAFAELATDHLGRFSVSVRNSRPLQKAIEQKVLGMSVIRTPNYFGYEIMIVDPTNKVYVLRQSGSNR